MQCVPVRPNGTSHEGWQIPRTPMRTPHTPAHSVWGYAPLGNVRNSYVNTQVILNPTPGLLALERVGLFVVFLTAPSDLQFRPGAGSSQVMILGGGIRGLSLRKCEKVPF